MVDPPAARLAASAAIGVADPPEIVDIEVREGASVWRSQVTLQHDDCGVSNS